MIGLLLPMEQRFRYCGDVFSAEHVTALSILYQPQRRLVHYFYASLAVYSVVLHARSLKTLDMRLSLVLASMRIQTLPTLALLHLPPAVLSKNDKALLSVVILFLGISF